MSNCEEPHETFHTTKEWLKHMEKDHRNNIVQWICRASKHAPKIMHSPAEFEKHMEAEHPKSYTKAQLPALLKTSGVPAPAMFPQCPLCSWFPGDNDIGVIGVDVGINDGGASPSPDQPHLIESEASLMKKRLKMERHIADHLLSIALMSLISRKKAWSDQSVQSVSASSTSSSCVGSVSKISNFDRYFDNSPEVETETRMAEIAIPDCDHPNWDQVYQRLSGRNKLPLRCGFSLSHDCCFIALILILSDFGPLVENHAFIERPTLFRNLLANIKRPPGFTGTRNVILTSKAGMG
jgi:hypothetical protein